ncbi:MAG: hypothetical protein Q9182_006387 [Xanthomendoza sp. 2 TL-2023]
MLRLRFLGLLWTIQLATTINSTLSLKPESTTTLTNHLSTLEVIPNPFIWNPNPNNKMIFIRKMITRRLTPDNPGISLPSWQHAVSKAQERLESMQAEAHASATDFLPGNQFHYEETAISQTMSSTYKRLRFQMDGPRLPYGRVQVALLGLLAYMHIWDTSSQNQQILMCNFTYTWALDTSYGFAHGRAIISVHNREFENSPDVS